MKAQERINRQEKDLIVRLIHHLELLVEYSEKAFYYYEHEKYLGEIAGKLRVLGIDYGRNKSLLFNLMEQFEYEKEFIMDNTNQIFTLRKYMTFHAIAGPQFSFTNDKIVRYVSQQIGASHEDWTLDNELHELIHNPGMNSNSSSYIHMRLRQIVNTILSEATAFLLYLNQNNILQDYGIDYPLPKILALETIFPQAMDWSIEERKKRNIVVKPLRSNLEKYTTLLMEGRLHHLSIKLDGIVPREVLRKHGFSNPFYDEKTKKFYGFEEPRSNLSR